MPLPSERTLKAGLVLCIALGLSAIVFVKIQPLEQTPLPAHTHASGALNYKNADATPHPAAKGTERTSAQSQMSLEEKRLRVTQVAPKDGDQADTMAAEYLDNEEELFALLKERYGVPVAGAKVNPRSAQVSTPAKVEGANAVSAELAAAKANEKASTPAKVEGANAVSAELAAAKANVKALQQLFVDCLSERATDVSACSSTKAAADAAVASLNALRATGGVPTPQAARDADASTDPTTTVDDSDDDESSNANVTAVSADIDNRSSNNGRVCSMVDIFPRLDLPGALPEESNPNVRRLCRPDRHATLRQDCICRMCCRTQGSYN